MIQANGRLQVVRETVGQTFLQNRMEAVDAWWGGEPNGHFMWRRDLHPYADAIFTTAKVVELLSHAGAPLSELRNGYPQVYQVQTKSRPWRRAIPEVRDQVVAFMQAFGLSEIDVELDDHVVWGGADHAALVVRQSPFDHTVHVEMDGLDLGLVQATVRQVITDVLAPLGVEMSDLDAQVEAA